MIRRELLIASAIVAGVVTTACSDVTGPQTLAPRVNLSVGSASAPGAQGSRPCVAPGGGWPGALNMLHDPTMFTIPMVRDAPQGNAGMFRAVAVSSC